MLIKIISIGNKLNSWESECIEYYKKQLPLEIRGVSKNDRLDAANKILEIVELQGWGNKFAHELSGGMQQRVGLARALAADPEFLLMDEPFSALDPLIRRQLQSEFIKLSKQMIREANKYKLKVMLGCMVESSVDRKSVV